MWRKPDLPAIQPRHPLAAGLVMALPFGEGSGEPRDLAFGTQSVRSSPLVAWAKGSRGPTLWFPGGGNTNVLVAAHPRLAMEGRDFSLSCVINREAGSTTGYDTIWFRGAALSSQKIYILVDPTGVLFRWDLFDSGVTLAFNRYYHILYTFSAASDTSGTEAFYVDGVQVARRTGSIPASSTATLRVGSSFNQHGFMGTIDAPMMWVGRCLTAADARMLALDPFLVVRPSSSRRLLVMGSGAAPPIVPGTARPGPAAVVVSVPGPTAVGVVVRPPLHVPRNNVYAALAAAHPTGTGTLTMAAGQGGRFGDPTEEEPIRVTVARPTAFGPNGHVDPDALTIYSVTGRSGDTLTGCTPIEGTPDRDYAPGDHAAMWMTAGALDDIHAALETLRDAPPPPPGPHQHAATDIIDFDAAAGAVADQAVAAHELEADPHPAYLRQAEADALYLTPAAADASFLTPAEGNAAYQPLDADLTQLASNNGSALTGLNATALATGIVADARLSANVPLKDASSTFVGKNTISVADNATSGDIRALTVSTSHAPPSASTAVFQAIYAQPNTGGTANVGQVFAFNCLVNHASAARVDNAFGARGSIQVTNTTVAAATVQATNLYAFHGVVNHAGSGTATNAAGISLSVGCSHAAGTITFAKGIQVESPPGAGSISYNSGIYFQNQGRAGIYMAKAIEVAAQSGSTFTYAIHTLGGLVKFEAGSVVLSGAALATTVTSGFTYVPSMSGTPTGVPVAQAGTIPMVVDTSGSKLWFYVGGAWKGCIIS